MNKVRLNIFYSLALAIMLVPAPYSKAYFGFIPKGNEVKEKTADLYSVFTRGPKAIVKGFEGTSQDIKLGFERSKELAKHGYACALHGLPRQSTLNLRVNQD